MAFMDDFEDFTKTKPKQAKVEERRPTVYRTFDKDELVHIVRKSKVEGYDDFTLELYPHSLNFYDFEVFMGDWMVVIINPVSNTKMVIANDREALRAYYRRHKDEIWVGYNSRVYDTFILKAILIGVNPKMVSDEMIVGGKSGWSICRDFSDIQLYNFDIMDKMKSLKQLEAFMGNDIRETSVSFDIDRPLTEDEVEETVKYCTHDVEQTIEVFRRRKSDFDAHMSIVDTFHLPLSMISLTQAQLTANVIGCEKTDYRGDEFDIRLVDTLRIEKYKHIVDWFRNPANYDYRNSLVANVCGIPHTFGWGGLHGCPDEPIQVDKSKGSIWHADVTSFYPSLMIVYDLLTRNCRDKGKYKKIYDTRVALKKAGKKKEQAPYKIALNSTYGICKDKYSKAYDPRQANNVCVNGQLLLLDLIEHLEEYIQLEQSNTDGLIYQVKKPEYEDKVKEVCDEWMERTGMGLGFDEIDWIVQRDVNSYIFRFSNGKYERKGAYLKELSDLDYDLPIVNEAMVAYITEDKPVEDTVNGCDELIKFQKVVRVSSNYKVGWHNGEYLNDRTFRVFASKDHRDTYIGRAKTEGGSVEKFADTPVNCFIDNSDVKSKSVPSKLDRNWYIRLAKDRLKNFGVSIEDEDRLF